MGRTVNFLAHGRDITSIIRLPAKKLKLVDGRCLCHTCARLSTGEESKMDWKRVLAVAGILLLVVGLALLWTLRRGRLAALALDRNPRPHGPVTGSPAGCGQLVEPQIELGRRVMALGESQALTVRLANASAETCEVTITLNAPDFQLSPLDPRRQLPVGPARHAEIAWILTPEAVGTFDLVLTVGGAITVLGLTVTNALGLTAGQLQLLSALSSFLGPLLTAPWWFEQWQAWQARKREEKEQEQRPLPFE